MTAVILPTVPRNPGSFFSFVFRTTSCFHFQEQSLFFKEIMKKNDWQSDLQSKISEESKILNWKVLQGVSFWFKFPKTRQVLNYSYKFWSRFKHWKLRSLCAYVSLYSKLRQRLRGCAFPSSSSSSTIRNKKLKYQKTTKQSAQANDRKEENKKNSYD